MAVIRKSSLAAPFPEETIYSWLTRYGLLSGFPDQLSFLQYFCNYKGQQLTSVFPGYLCNLIKYSEIDPDRLIVHHSLLPYFRPFTNSQVYRKVTNHLTRGGASDGFSQLSMLANRIPESKDLFFCPLCLSDDLKKYGVGYWHVPHQLPWAGICHLHNIELQAIKRQRKVLELPPQEVDNVIVESSTFSGRSLAIATSSHFLWQKNSLQLDVDKVVQLYKTQLYRTGLATKSGSMRQYAWRKALMEFWNGILPEELDFALFSDKNFQSFPNNLIYQPYAQHHPLKHLIVINHLFGSVAEFLSAYSSETDIELPSLLDETLLTDSVHFTKVQKLIIDLRNGLSLRQAATLSNVSISFVKAKAIHNAIPIERRAQKLFAPEREQILNQLCEGSNTKEIAIRMMCSVSAVEQILTQNPELVDLRAKLRCLRLKIKHRTSLVVFIESHQVVKRVEVQRGCRASYTWLFKHDKEWLYDHLPAAVPRKDRYTRENQAHLHD